MNSVEKTAVVGAACLGVLWAVLMAFMILETVGYF
jgi:hypothetical protein